MYIFGLGFSMIISAVLYTYAFKQKFRISLLFVISICITWQLLIIMNEVMIGSLYQDHFVPYSIKIVSFGLFDGLTHIYLDIIGPLLVAANNRKSFEVTMGGTMISVIMATSYVFS